MTDIIKITRPPHLHCRLPRVASPAGDFPRLKRRKYALAALRGEECDDTYRYDIGSRAGELNGFAVEHVDGQFEAVEYRARHVDGMPLFTRREVFFRAPARLD